MKFQFTLMACAVASLLSACHSPPAGSDLFPLDAGHHWQYAVTTEGENETVEHSILTISTVGRDDIDGTATWRRRSDDGVDYWLRRDATGIYRVATKSDVEAEPKMDAERRYVLKLPLAAGASWRASTTPYLLKRRQEFPRELRHSHPSVPMQYTIETLDIVVTVPAGRFEHCVQVKGAATVRVFADPVIGWRDMPLTTIESYCPGVGLVRLERQEPAQATFLTGGSMKLELQEWQ
jgi:hypothetical protein